MITREELKGIARFSRLKVHQQEKHYIQTIALNSIYSTITDELVFKGGTCLLFFHGLNRFSEDLDFTMVKSMDINKIIKNIKRDLENLGINHKLSNPKENNISISFKIGAEGPLFNKEIERCFISVEISKREGVENKELKELKSSYPGIFNFSVYVMSEEEILAEKIRAIMTRNQARDLYDAYFLMRKNVDLDLKLVDKKLEYYKTKFDKKRFMESVDNKEGVWISELNALIIGELPDFKDVKKLVKSKIF